MLLHKVILENYGLYDGFHEFDLTPRTRYGKKRPIILFGGMNGSGKTTILDAVRLVFYGKSSLSQRTSQREYEQFLLNRIHRPKNALISPTFSRVGIEFDYVMMGLKERFYVERSWSKTNGGRHVKEYLKINRNDEQLDDVSQEYWKSFIEEIIPERLSQLFFFDAEKIKNIAEDNSGNLALADSIRSLLGLDIVEKLKADLSLYSSRERKNCSGKSDKEKLEELGKQIGDLKHIIEGIQAEDIPSIKTEINGLEAEIRNKERDLYQEGQVFASQSTDLKCKKDELATKIEEIEGKIRAECEETLSFSLCPNIVEVFQKQILIEQENKRQSVINKVLTSVEKEIVSSVAAKKSQISKESQKKFIQIVKSIVNKKTSIKSNKLKGQFLLELSDVESQKLLGWITDATKGSKTEIQKQSKLLSKSTRELQKIQKQLAKAPDEIQLKPIVDKLAALNKSLGNSQEKKNSLEKDVRSKEYELAGLQREENKILDSQKQEGRTRIRLDLVKKTQIALDDYLRELTKKKIEQLRHTVADCFNRLCRKEDLLHRIEINPDTFDVTFHNKEGDSLPKKDLSSGEKQIYAISMLWSLAKTSGRPLPVIIDTPLGRLDSDHRSNLISYYFPHAAHQVIIFSTDTEVDQKLYKELSPNISHCYHLEYDKKYRQTNPVEGYFWRELAYA